MTSKKNISKISVIVISIALLAGLFLDSLPQLLQTVAAQVQNSNKSVSINQEINKFPAQVAKGNPGTNIAYLYQQLLTSLATPGALGTSTNSGTKTLPGMPNSVAFPAGSQIVDFDILRGLVIVRLGPPGGPNLPLPSNADIRFGPDSKPIGVVCPIEFPCGQIVPQSAPIGVLVPQSTSSQTPPTSSVQSSSQPHSTTRSDNSVTGSSASPNANEAIPGGTPCTPQTPCGNPEPYDSTSTSQEPTFPDDTVSEPAPSVDVSYKFGCVSGSLPLGSVGGKHCQWVIKCAPDGIKCAVSDCVSQGVSIPAGLPGSSLSLYNEKCVEEPKPCPPNLDTSICGTTAAEEEEVIEASWDSPKQQGIEEILPGGTADPPSNCKPQMCVPKPPGCKPTPQICISPATEPAGTTTIPAGTTTPPAAPATEPTNTPAPSGDIGGLGAGITSRQASTTPSTDQAITGDPQISPPYFPPILSEPQPYLPPQTKIIEGLESSNLDEMQGLMKTNSELTEEEKQLAESIGESIASIESESASGSGGGSEEEIIIIEEETGEGDGSGGGSEQENTQPQGQRSAS